MHFFAALSLALAGAASASAALVARQSEPQCLASCYTSGALGGCTASDNKCLCTSGLFIGTLATCIATTCPPEDLPNAFAFAQQTCEAVGVTLTMFLPTSTITGIVGPTSVIGTTPAVSSVTPAGSSTSASASGAPASPVGGSSSASATSSSAPGSTSSSAAKSNNIPVVAGVGALFAALVL